MRRLFAIALVVLALLLVAGVLLVRPALAGTPRCTTDEEKTLGRLQTVCDKPHRHDLSACGE